MKAKTTYPEKNINQKIGTCIRKLREEQRLTLEGLGMQCNMGHSKVSKIENGETSLKPDDAVVIAKCLGVSVSYLYGETKNKMPATDSPLYSSIKIGILALFNTLGVDEQDKMSKELREMYRTNKTSIES